MPWKDDYTTSDEIALTDDQIAWPGGKRSCAMITVDLSLAKGAKGVTEGDLQTDRAMFALNEGLDAVVSILADAKLKATFAVPGVMASTYGDRLVELLAAGHEIAAHGFQHEDVSALSRAEEAERITAATEMIADVTGQAPVGWYSLPRQSDPFAVGTVSANTIDLLAESNYLYFCPGLADDAPYYWVSDFQSRKNILALPYYFHFDDQFFLLFPSRGTGLEHMDALYANWMAEFDAQYARGRCFSMVLHPHAIAWCNRNRKLSQFVRHMADHRYLWNPTGAECARYWLEAYPERTHLKLAPTIWQDHDGSLS